MEARSAFYGAAVSKTFIVAVLVAVAISLGVMGAYLASNLGGSKATTPTQTIQAPVNGNPQPAPARPLRVS